MSLVGLIHPSKFLSEFAQLSKRDASQPFLMMKGDRLLILAALSIPSVTLALCIFLGTDMYHISGIQLSQAVLKFDRWTEVDYVKNYCWSHLNHLSNATGTPVEIPLYHYSYFPFIMFTIILLFYTPKLLWRLVNLYKLAHGLDYILDGLEESIRDIMECFLDELKSNSILPTHPTNHVTNAGDSFSNNNQCPGIHLPDMETDIDNADVEMQTLTSGNNGNTAIIRSDSRREKSMEQPQLFKGDSQLCKKMESYQKIKQLDEKYKYFNIMLMKFAKSKYFSKKVRHMRIYFCFVILLVQFVVYYLYLQEERNPVEIYCPLPPQFYYSDPKTNKEITRTLVLYAPVVIRTTVMWSMFSANILLMLSAFVIWSYIAKTESPGLRLLKKLPSVKIDDQLLSKNSDLCYLMELVYVNRNRLQFVKFGFNIQAATDSIIGKTASNEAFLSIFRETVMWMRNLENDEKLNNIVQAVNTNMATE